MQGWKHATPTSGTLSARDPSATAITQGDRERRYPTPA